MTMKMGQLGLRQGQGAGDAADVCDVLCPRYMIFVLENLKNANKKALHSANVLQKASKFQTSLFLYL